ncbi:hypothetical protein WH47_12486 [Habropoda laboriosa]|uniref:Uncharacterized protein n=1 Tax=Habropoda laboriosa TaxID=597456 RepID=A0A0L7QZY4_9HYME|nr:hypothetical protein WH47_12486 [Habropoda laboriosa]
MDHEGAQCKLVVDERSSSRLVPRRSSTGSCNAQSFILQVLRTAELFRNAAEAGPLDIVKLCKGDKVLNISTNLPANTPDSPYVLQIVGAHPASSGVIEAEVLWALERRVAALERQLREHQEALYATPTLALRELKRQVDSFKNKLEHNDHLSWLSFYKQLPEPLYADSCRRLQYRRKSDSMKRKVREKFLNMW